jgi:hypothetical protein
VAQTDFPRLRPLLEIIGGGGVLQKGLTGEEIMQTFLSRGFNLFTSERQLWGHLQGQVASFTPPFPDWAAQRPMPRRKKL